MKSAARGNVLIVDDDKAMLRLLRKWLESDGFVVREAYDGRHAVELIEAECPQILLTDWEMPRMNGMELCHWVRGQSLPNYIYTVFLTIRGGSDDIVRGLEAGADDFLKKPVDKCELLARLRAGSRVLDLERRLSLLAKCDPLTGLATQRTFYEQMEREWSRAKRVHSPLSCVMADVDFFKRVNDTYGHAAGDEVIRHVARTLLEGCRRTDLVSRYGGEEFCVMLPDTDEQGALIWASRMRAMISATKVRIDGREIGVTASLGVAERLDDTLNPADLVDLADQALLVAKRSGRDRAVCFRSITETRQPQSTASPGSMFGGVRAGDVMTTIVAGLQQHDSAGRAAEYFLRFRINSAPVVDEEGKLVGILAEKDVMAIMLWPRWWDTKISDIMKRNVVCYDEDASVQAIYEFLCRVAIRGVIIVKGGRPTGVISRGSVLRWFTNTMLMESPQGGGERLPASEDAICNARQSLGATTRAVRNEAERLERRLGEADVDATPAVVGTVSRMQELLNDLLSYSRYLNAPASCEGFAPASSQAVGDDTQRGLGGLLGASELESGGAGGAWIPPAGEPGLSAPHEPAG
jgi:diguanylate cyclase (GGDEF)-like protein